MILVENPETAARTLGRRTPVRASQQRFGNANASALTPKLLAPPQQPAGAPSLTIVNGGRKRGVTKYG
jgi:hypothetical protein